MIIFYYIRMQEQFQLMSFALDSIFFIYFKFLNIINFLKLILIKRFTSL